MKNNKVQNTHYLSLSYSSLISNKVLHNFLFLIDVVILLLQILEIYYNQYKSLKADDFKYMSFISKIIQSINKLKIEFQFIIYIIIIIIETGFSFVLNNFNLSKNKFWSVIINITEILFHRIGTIFMFHFLFNFNDIYLIVGIILTIPFLFILIGCFRTNHLFYFFLSVIKYPYDSFSKIIDLHLLAVKIFLSISSMSNNKKILIFFFCIISFNSFIFANIPHLFNAQ